MEVAYGRPHAVIIYQRNNRYNADMRALILLITAAALLSASDAGDRVASAAFVLQEIMSVKERSIPQDLLNKAECAIVVPGMKKGAFIIGAKYGRGFVSCRKGGAGWTAPAGVRIEGGSFGFQIGGSETDLLMLVLNRRGMDKLLTSKFTLGGDASVAAGPVGRTSSAETDALMRAEILSWSRSRGVFAGISLKGSTMRTDDEANRQLYGKEVENREILTGGVQPPETAAKFVSLLNKYSGRK
jgi:lipid-binding SYLF domain-containing protein